MTDIAAGTLAMGRMQAQKASQDAVMDSLQRSGVKGRDRQKVRELSRNFEAIFTGIMLKSMRESVQKSGLIDSGNAQDIYRSLLDAEYAKLMASQGSPGLAKTIERYLLDAMGMPKADPSLAGNRAEALKAYGAESVHRLPRTSSQATIKSEP